MNYTKIVFSFIIMIGFYGVSFGKERVTKDLCNIEWKFREVGKKEWMSATVPGTVHTDLMSNGVIEDPFYRTNEKDVQWIGYKDWEYTAVFNVHDSIMNMKNIDIQFDGLDTYADVYINDSLILSANNMHRRWEKSVKQYLKQSDNVIRILFHSPINKVKPLYDSLGYIVPVTDNDQAKERLSPFTRKAGYHFGWDWGPRLVTSGIWRPIRLVGWNDIKIQDMFVRQLSLSDDGRAEVEAIIETNSKIYGTQKLDIYVDNSKIPVYSSEIFIPSHEFDVMVRFKIDNIERWWPNGMGEQKLYRFNAVIRNNKGEIIDEFARRIGFRTVELVQKSHKNGKSFEFYVNGKPVFMKGANYIPMDSFLPRVTEERVEDLISSAKAANMNMLRVWGGGTYESDLFYDKCDEAGILIWQDFMFGCALQPPYETHKDNIYLEAIDNVKRLRNHPCMAMWCGNNEIMMIFGGDVKRRPEGKWDKRSWDLFYTYVDIFNKTFPAVIKAYDPDRFYWSTSPNGANYQEENRPNWYQGDMHYWGVWHGRESFEKFDQAWASFFSEYGFQSFPEIETVEQYALPEDYDIESKVMAAHQRSGIGNLRIAQYMKDWYKTPVKFDEFLYVGQLLQAEGMKMGIEAHRRLKPYCMGTLYWQIDDCWPVASWSSIDYYGRWKAMHYFVKDAYKPIIISTVNDKGKIKIWTVSDLYINKELNLQYTVCDFSGKVLLNKKETVLINPNSSAVIKEIEESSLVGEYDKRKLVMKVILSEKDGDIVYEDYYYFNKPKDIVLPKCNVKVKMLTENLIQITTDKLAKNIWLRIPGKKNMFNENYFDLLPGEVKIVRCKELTPKDMRALKVMTLNSIKTKNQ